MNQQEKIWLNVCECVCGCSLRSLCHLSWWERFAESVSLRALDTTNNREECTIQYSNNDSLLHLITLLQFFLFQYSTFTYLLHTALFPFLIFYVYISLSVSVDIFSLVKNYFVRPCALDWGGGYLNKTPYVCVCLCLCACCQKQVTWRPMSFFSRVIPHVTNSLFHSRGWEKNNHTHSLFIHMVYVQYIYSIYI